MADSKVLFVLLFLYNVLDQTNLLLGPNDGSCIHHFIYISVSMLEIELLMSILLKSKKSQRHLMTWHGNYSRFNKLLITVHAQMLFVRENSAKINVSQDHAKM